MPFIVYFLGLGGFGPQKWVFERPLRGPNSIEGKKESDEPSALHPLEHFFFELMNGLFMFVNVSFSF